TRYLFIGCEPSGIFTDPSHQRGPTGGLPGNAEKEEPYSLLPSGLTALVQRSWNAYPGIILPIARRPDHRTHLGLTSIGELHHVAVGPSCTWFDLDLSLLKRLFQLQAQHRLWLCFEPGSQTPLAINFQEAQVIQVPEEAFAQQRKWDK